MRNTPAFLLEVANLQLAQFFAAQRVVEEGGENSAITLALEGLAVWLHEKLAGLMITEGRGLSFSTFHFRPLNTLHWIVGDGVLVAEVFKKRRQCRKPVPDARAS